MSTSGAIEKRRLQKIFVRFTNFVIGQSVFVVELLVIIS
jgi:hypothetical protein